MNKPALFCGVVRNGGSALQATLDNLDAVRSKFEDTKFIIVTNDNTDLTDKVLNDWAKTSQQRNIVIRVDGLLEAFPNRIDRICAARNFYLRRAQFEVRNGNWSYCIIADLDGPNENLDPNWFNDIEKFPVAWDAIFANQIDAYYDIYALRHDQWCPKDCWIEVESSISRIIKRVPKVRTWIRHSLVNKLVFARQHKIAPTHSPIKVTSAFGGLGVYRVKALEGIYYGCRRVTNHVVCEHVVFNEAIAKRGGNLYIAPNLINAAPKEHLGKSSGSVFPEYQA